MSMHIPIRVLKSIVSVDGHDADRQSKGTLTTLLRLRHSADYSSRCCWRRAFAGRKTQTPLSIAKAIPYFRRALEAFGDADQSSANVLYNAVKVHSAHKHKRTHPSRGLYAHTLRVIAASCRPRAL